jgi:hypothetical protein
MKTDRELLELAAKACCLPECPECKAVVLYECVACSNNNYPPRREWVGIEAEDLTEIDSDDFWSRGNHMSIAMAVEAKLKAKNT